MSACPLGQCDGSGVVVASFVSAAECVANLQVACACVAERVRELEKLQCEQGISGCDCNRPIESASPITVDEEQEECAGKIDWEHRYVTLFEFAAGEVKRMPSVLSNWRDDARARQREGG